MTSCFPLLLPSHYRVAVIVDVLSFAPSEISRIEAKRFETGIRSWDSMDTASESSDVQEMQL